MAGPYYAINRLAETPKPEGERDLSEIHFADRLWILVRLDRLVQVVRQAGV